MPQDDTPPLATYAERLPQVQRVLELHADRVEVRARWTLGKRHRMTVKLSDLVPTTQTLFIRNRLAKRSIVLGSLAVAAAVVFGQPGYAPWIRAVAPAGWFIAAACVGVAIMTFRKTVFVRFLRRDGRPGLDIGKAGPEAEAFEGFVEAVRRAIRSAR